MDAAESSCFGLAAPGKVASLKPRPLCRQTLEPGADIPLQGGPGAGFHGRACSTPAEIVLDRRARPRCRHRTDVHLHEAPGLLAGPATAHPDLAHGKPDYIEDYQVFQHFFVSCPLNAPAECQSAGPPFGRTATRH